MDKRARGPLPGMGSPGPWGFPTCTCAHVCARTRTHTHMHTLTGYQHHVGLPVSSQGPPSSAAALLLGACSWQWSASLACDAPFFGIRGGSSPQRQPLGLSQLAWRAVLSVRPVPSLTFWARWVGSLGSHRLALPLCALSGRSLPFLLGLWTPECVLGVGSSSVGEHMVSA